MSRKRKHNSRILKKKNRLNREFLFPMFRRVAVIASVAVVSLWLISWVWFGGMIQNIGSWMEDRTISLTSRAGFNVENVLVEGRENVDKKLLMSLIGIKTGQSLFDSDLADIRLKIEALEWVESAVVKRKAPGDLYISIRERQPVALLKNSNKSIVLLDKDGHIINVPIQQKFRQMIIVSGEGVEKETFSFISELENHIDIRDYIDVAYWIGDRRWDLIMKSGMRIQMPEDDFDQALGRLNDLQSQTDILSKPLDLIDLRQEGRVIARPKEGYSFDYNDVAPASGKYQASRGGYEL